MKRFSCHRAPRAIFVLYMAIVLVACRPSANEGAPGSPPPSSMHMDSASGDVSQYSLMADHIGWLTDSNLVALATIVNDAPVQLARLESQAWTDQQVHDFALEIIRDHAAFQATIDSIAGHHRIPSQQPALTDSLRAPYDLAVTALRGLSAPQMNAKFLAVENDVHARSLIDFGALAGNATDPDLRAVLAIRATAMEQQHIARLKRLVASLAQADSAKQSARRGRQP